MRLELAHVTSRRERFKSSPAQVLVEDYVRRASRLAPIEHKPYRSEEQLLATISSRGGKLPLFLVLLDSDGRQFTSEQFADLHRRQRDQGTQEMLLAIGPPNGWSRVAREKADLFLSLGLMTMPHELALVVLAEQTYRALTILAGHPYHNGHLDPEL